MLTQHLKDIITKNYHISDNFILLLYDTQCALARTLSEAYEEVISSLSHKTINFFATTEEAILQELSNLPPHSLVILVQSTSFRMTKHRLRADLFRQGHMVIEHARLSFNEESEIKCYINALAYQTPYYVAAGNVIEQLIRTSNVITILSKNNILNITSEFESPLQNTGDFTNNPIKAVGFPVGEIFTEARDLKAMNGSIVVFGFPTLEHKNFFCEPFTVTIEEGCLISHTGPKEFDEILHKIKDDEITKTVPVREIGFGLNKALGFYHRLHEPTSFERFAGVHFSLGLKHAMYQNKLGRKTYQKYHIDIFCLADTITIGNTIIFKEGEYLV